MKSTGKREVFEIVVLMGLLALSVIIFWNLSRFPFDTLFGHMWTSRVRHALIDSGVSADFVARYVSFLLLHVPIWCLLLVVTFCLGLNTNRLARIATVSFTAWLPVMGFAHSLWFYGFSGDALMMRADRDVMFMALFGFNTRIVPALVTLTVGFVGWAIGSLASKLIGTSKPKRENAKHVPH